VGEMFSVLEGVVGETATVFVVSVDKETEAVEV